MIDNKKKARIKRGIRTKMILKKSNRIKLLVHRTPKHIYAQIIDTNKSKVLASASTLEKKIKNELKYTGNKQAACLIGEKIAERSLEKGIKNVSLDRSGFKYHGRIKELADAARKNGLLF